MKSKKLQLARLHGHPEQPYISIIGRGERAYLWIGNRSCYSFTECSARELREFAVSILMRLDEKGLFRGAVESGDASGSSPKNLPSPSPRANAAPQFLKKGE